MRSWTLTGVPVVLAALLGAAAWLPAQEEPPFRPTQEQIDQIRKQAAELKSAINGLREGNVDDRLLAEVEIFHKAAEWILRYPEEFYRPNYVDFTLAAISTGLDRADQLRHGKPSWPASKGRVARAYRSRVDGSVQPFGMVIPAAYTDENPARLDVILHGRNSRITEASFLAQVGGDEPLPDSLQHLELHVFGRTNNAYRWAGESDVFEALAAARRNYKIDRARIVLRGFSMGGAGAWHIGLHYPDLWAAVEAGAGFTETLNYASASLAKPVPDYQIRAMRIYDAVEAAPNAYNLPMVGYGGEDDAQLQAAVNIREALARGGARFAGDGLNFTTKDLNALFLVGPETGHKFHPDSKARSEAFLSAALEEDRQIPEKIRFVTYTERYGRCFWIEVDGIEPSGYASRAEVEGERLADAHGDLSITLQTRNVARLVIKMAEDLKRLTLDGQELSVPEKKSYSIFAGKISGKWRLHSSLAEMRGGGLVKRPGLSGPIDDAFRDSFLVVRPSGEPHAAATAIADRFTAEFPKWMRGDAPQTIDVKVSEEQIREANLVLFGDPDSNQLIGKIAADLPIAWDSKSIRVGSKSYSAKNHLLAMIYPNPLNPNRYIVLNSGHTFHEPEFRGTNALLFPRLGDWAVLRVDGDEPTVAAAGFFDENWKLPSERQ